MAGLKKFILVSASGELRLRVVSFCCRFDSSDQSGNVALGGRVPCRDGTPAAVLEKRSAQGRRHL